MMSLRQDVALRPIPEIKSHDHLPPGYPSVTETLFYIAKESYARLSKMPTARARMRELVRRIRRSRTSPWLHLTMRGAQECYCGHSDVIPPFQF